MQTRLQKSLQNCGICYDKVITQGKLECCNHIFCFACIKSWADRQNSCPLCKRRFNTIQKIQKRVRYSQKTEVENKIVQVELKDQEQPLQRLLARAFTERILLFGQNQDMDIINYLFALDLIHNLNTNTHYMHQQQ